MYYPDKKNPGRFDKRFYTRADGGKMTLALSDGGIAFRKRAPAVIGRYAETNDYIPT